MAGTNPVTLNARCERARHWVSLRLDGELSTIEESLLERHLAECEACAALDARLGVATSLLRDAPPEVPDRRVALPRRRSVRFPFQARRTALVAAAALVVGAVTGSLVQRPSSSVPTPKPRAVSFLSRDLQ